MLSVQYVVAAVCYPLFYLGSEMNKVTEDVP